MIEQGHYVKVIFKNSTQAEGFVEKWSDNEAILASEDESSRFIIFDVKDSVLGVKICYDGPTEKVAGKKFEELAEQFKAVQAEPSEDDLRLKKLGELKTLMNEQERKIISDKVRSHTITGVKFPTYGNQLSAILRKK